MQTVYTATRHCRSATEIIDTLSGIGLGASVVADECRKIAASCGPRSPLYQDAFETLHRSRRMPRECNALGGA